MASVRMSAVCSASHQISAKENYTKAYGLEITVWSIGSTCGGGGEFMRRCEYVFSRVCSEMSCTTLCGSGYAVCYAMLCSGPRRK